MSSPAFSLTRGSALPQPKTSSERGRKFRERQRQREASLVKYNNELREQIRQLERTLHQQREEETRACWTWQPPESAHQRTLREFFMMFRDGLDGEPSSLGATQEICFKEAYLRHVFDPEVAVGDASGVQAMIAQWRMYTAFHDSFRLEVRDMDVLGSEENPLYHVHAKITVQISRRTFENLFPAALHNEELAHKFLHRVVEYDCTVWVHFANSGRIDQYTVNINFIDGLRRAGGSIEEVAALLAHRRILPMSTL